MAHKRAHEYDGAVGQLMQAIVLDRDLIEAHYALAWTLVAMDETSKACALFRRVTALAPGTELAREAEAALDRIRRRPQPGRGARTAPLDSRLDDPGRRVWPYVPRQGTPLPEIVASARGDSPRETARCLYDWVRANIEYDREKFERKKPWRPQPAVETVTRKRGDCYDYVVLYGTLCRMAGIPTRAVHGRGKWGSHWWNEIHLEGEGWVPVDTERGRFRDCFGSLDSDLHAGEVDDEPGCMRTNLEPMRQEAEKLRAAGDLEAAADRWDEAILAYEPSPYLYRLAADAHLQADRPERGLALLMKATELDPQEAAAWEAMAHVHRQVGRPAPALMAAKRAAELGHYDARVCRSLGYLYWTMGRFEEALQMRLRAEELGDDSPHLQLDLGATLTKLGRAGEALPHLEAARDELSDAPDLQEWLARAYMALGRPQEALEAYERAIALRPAAREELQPVIDRARAGLGVALPARRDG